MLCAVHRLVVIKKFSTYVMLCTSCVFLVLMKYMQCHIIFVWCMIINIAQNLKLNAIYIWLQAICIPKTSQKRWTFLCGNLILPKMFSHQRHCTWTSDTKAYTAPTLPQKVSQFYCTCNILMSTIVLIDSDTYAS